MNRAQIHSNIERFVELEAKNGFRTHMPDVKLWKIYKEKGGSSEKKTIIQQAQTKC